MAAVLRQVPCKRSNQPHSTATSSAGQVNSCCHSKSKAEGGRGGSLVLLLALLTLALSALSANLLVVLLQGSQVLTGL